MRLGSALYVCYKKQLYMDFIELGAGVIEFRAPFWEGVSLSYQVINLWQCYI